MGGNNLGLAIVRISSKRQEGNISHETQESEIRAYCDREGIKIEEIFRIVESAKDSDERAKYTAAINSALTRNIRHILFYMYDREARNMTDAEKNTKLVRADLLCLHYVREQKVLHKDSPSSDFFMRNIHAVMNTQFIDTLRAKVNDAMKQKAESGWYPSNKPPLGYVVQKLKDASGKEMKRGSIIVRDPDPKKVQWVIREFELRAAGYSLDQIRRQIIAEGFIDPRKANLYHKSSIDDRFTNPFYEGKFRWQGVEYQGKHELIIPPHLIQAARRPRGVRLVRPDSDHGVLVGWIKCAECGCYIVYDPKVKSYRTTGRTHTFHYYRCSNGRRMHASQKGMNVLEEFLWEQLDHAVEAITLGDELAGRIAAALNENHRAGLSQTARDMDRYKSSISALESREDRAYNDFVEGVLDREAYGRLRNQVRAERTRLSGLLLTAQAEVRGQFRESARSVIELSKQAKPLYLTRSPSERRMFLEKIVSNPVLSGRSLRYDLKSPFNVLAKMNSFGEWRTHLDEFRTECAALQGGYSFGKHDKPSER